MEYIKTLTTLVDIFRKDDKGEEICMHEGIVLRKSFDLRFIYPEETLRKGGQPYKNKCIIYDDVRKENNLIRMGYQQLIELKESLTKHSPMGYKK